MYLCSRCARIVQQFDMNVYWQREQFFCAVRVVPRVGLRETCNGLLVRVESEEDYAKIMEHINARV